jgi:uncharacterized membrane protein YfcA
MEQVILLAVFSSITSLVTAVAGLGGGVLLLALMAQLLNPMLLIPLHGIAQFFSNFNRGLVHRHQLQWRYLIPFMVGSAAGAFAFLPLVVMVDDRWGGLALGIFILIATWRPHWLKLQKMPALIGGAITSGLGVLFGASGPLAMSAHPKETWNKLQIVGNHGAAMAFQHGIKVVAYMVGGVQLWGYIPEIIALFVGAWLGTWMGTLVLHKLTDDRFKTLLNIVLTVLALRLVIIHLFP